MITLSSKKWFSSRMRSLRASSELVLIMFEECRTIFSLSDPESFLRVRLVKVRLGSGLALGYRTDFYQSLAYFFSLSDRASPLSSL